MEDGNYLHYSFHYMPKYELLRKQWIIKIKTDEGLLGR